MTVLTSELESIRKTIKRLTIVPSGQDTNIVNFVSQGDLMLGQLQDWLLDDEQKQVLGQNDWALFFMRAAAYLCDIGLMDGDSSHYTLINENNDQAIPTSLGQRSYNWIQHHWKELGIEDKARAELIADIVWCIDPTSNHGEKKPSFRNISYSKTVIDVTLLAGFLRLSKALALKTITTALMLKAYLPKNSGTAKMEEDPDAYFDVSHMGPHPYFPATIQVKINCRHPEVHRALKHYERFVQQQLTEFNQRLRPRFYFSDVFSRSTPPATSRWI
jgi:hypothetical protein